MNDNSAENKGKTSKSGAQKNAVMIIVAIVAVVALVTIMQRGGICCPGVAIGGTSGAQAGAATDSETSVVARIMAKTENNLPLMLNFGAKQCAPCRMMAPILDELKKDFQDVINVVYIDVWEKENTATARELNIQSIPTQILYDEHGKELWRNTGFVSRKEILDKWRSLGFDVEKLARKTNDEQ